MPCIYNKDGKCFLDKAFLSDELGPCVDADVCDDRVDSEDNFSREDEAE